MTDEIDETIDDVDTCEFSEIDDTEDEVIPQYSIIRVRTWYMKELRAAFGHSHPLLETALFIYLGEIPNMPGHCVVAQHGGTGMTISGFHTESFEVVPEEDM